MSNLVELTRFFDRPSAELLRGALQASGIEAKVMGDDMGGTRPDILMGTGVRVLVEEEVLDRAQAFLRDQEAGLNAADQAAFASISDESTLKEQMWVRQSYFTAVLGSFILPVAANMISLYVLIFNRRHYKSLSASDKRRVKIALAFDLVLVSIGVVTAINFVTSLRG